MDGSISTGWRFWFFLFVTLFFFTFTLFFSIFSWCDNWGVESIVGFLNSSGIEFTGSDGNGCDGIFFFINAGNDFTIGSISSNSISENFGNMSTGNMVDNLLNVFDISNRFLSLEVVFSII
jgi:hypothetical protein